MALLVEKGFEGVVAEAMHGGGGTFFSHTTILGKINFETLIWLLLSCAVMFIYIARYLLFSPWTIYDRIIDVGLKIEEVSDDDLEGKLANIKSWRILVAAIYFMVEFFLSFLIAQSIGKGGLLLVLILLLPVVDFIMTVLITLWALALLVILGFAYIIINASIDGATFVGLRQSHDDPEWLKNMKVKAMLIRNFTWNWMMPFWKPPFHFALWDGIDFVFPLIILTLFGIPQDTFVQFYDSVWSNSFDALQILEQLSQPWAELMIIKSIILGVTLSSTVHILFNHKLYRNIVGALLRIVK
jgi:hypothetical protein